MDRIEIGFKCGLVKDKFDEFKNDTGKIALTKGDSPNVCLFC